LGQAQTLKSFNYILVSLNLAFRLLKPDRVLCLIFLSLLLLFLQSLLMTLPSYFLAGVYIFVVFPHLKTDPAKLVLAYAGHMNAAVVFLDWGFAHGAFLSDNLINPLVLLGLQNVRPSF